MTSLRAGLRDRLLGSPLCDAKGFAAELNGKLRELWRGWCLGDEFRVRCQKTNPAEMAGFAVFVRRDGTRPSSYRL